MNCSPIPGMCGRSADCADQHCPGRVAAILEQRCGGAIIQDGHSLSDDDFTAQTALTAFELLVALLVVVICVPLGVWLWHTYLAGV